MPTVPTLLIVVRPWPKSRQRSATPMSQRRQAICTRAPTRRAVYDLIRGSFDKDASVGIRSINAKRGAMAYSLYILLCADGTYYTGIAKDVARRLSEHNGLLGNGAKYTSGRRPVEIVYEASFPSRSEALKEEMRVKRLTRSQKQELISGVI